SLPSERSSEKSSSDRRNMLALYAPHSPRSDVTTSTPARRGFSRGTSNGWSSALALASSVSMLVISRSYGRAASTRACALAIRDVAIISWALVIFLIDPAERMRPRSSRSVAAICYLGLLGCRLADLDGFLLQVLGIEGLGVLGDDHRAAVRGLEALLEFVDDRDQLLL